MTRPEWRLPGQRAAAPAPAAATPPPPPAGPRTVLVWFDDPTWNRPFPLLLTPGPRVERGGPAWADTIAASVTRYVTSRPWANAGAAVAEAHVPDPDDAIRCRGRIAGRRFVVVPVPESE